MSSGAESGCSRDCGACACRCPGRACPTATPGRSPPARGSCSSTPACTSPARWRTCALAMEQVNLRLEQVRLIVCTHAHSDHWGQVAPISEIAGCEFWMHPNHAHATRLDVGSRGGARPPARGRAPERRARVARSRLRGAGGAGALGHCGDRGARPRSRRRRGRSIRPRARGRSYETPGHAPRTSSCTSAERRLMISGDHLLGRISLYYDYGWSPDPVGEFLRSLELVAELDVAPVPSRATASRSSTSPGTSRATGRSCASALQAALDGARRRPARRSSLPRSSTAASSRATNARWWLIETLCYLTHLEHRGEVARSGTTTGPARTGVRGAARRAHATLTRSCQGW